MNTSNSQGNKNTMATDTQDANSSSLNTSAACSSKNNVIQLDVPNKVQIGTSGIVKTSNAFEVLQDVRDMDRNYVLEDVTNVNHCSTSKHAEDVAEYDSDVENLAELDDVDCNAKPNREADEVGELFSEIAKAMRPDSKGASTPVRKVFNGLHSVLEY